MKINTMDKAFPTARFGTYEIIPTQFNQELHYRRIFCPECGCAPLRFVKKEDGTKYFASNRRAEHSEDCSHYGILTSHDEIVRLMTSGNPTDSSSLDSLIQSTLSASIRTLLTLERPLLTDTLKVHLPANTLIRKRDRLKTTEKIERVIIKNLSRIQENSYVVVYGRSEVLLKLCTDQKKMDPETDIDQSVHSNRTIENSSRKQLLFKYNNRVIFSVFLTQTQSLFLIDDDFNKVMDFALFGKVIKVKQFTNIHVRSTQELMYRFPN